MITFLPTADFAEVARLLDDKRLGGQRTESWSILKWLRNPTAYPKLVKAGYCQMWAGYEEALVCYVNTMLVEWARRGRNNELLQPYDPSLGLQEVGCAPMPPWLGCHDLHAYHRSALLAKLPSHYEQFGWSESASAYNGSYPWPVCTSTDNGSDVWILRWPKATKIPPKLITAAPCNVDATTVKEESVKAAATAPSKKRKRASREDQCNVVKPGPLHDHQLADEAQAARPMSKTLTFGRKESPRALVVMLHGLTDTADGWHGSFAGSWARALRGVQIVVPQSPDECGAYSPNQRQWSAPGDRKFDWLAQPGVGIDLSDGQAVVRELQRITMARVAQLERWLDGLLQRHSLTNRQLILVGFSQGAILAAIAGTRRCCRGVVAVGGVPGQPIYDATVDDYVGGGWMDWEALVSRDAVRATRFCLINGTRDSYVPRKRNEAMLRDFDVSWHWDKGRGHDFPESWYAIALQWLKDALTDCN